MDVDRLEANLRDVESRIARAARESGRDVAGITLVAVTKKRSIESIRSLVALGVASLGENYPQELWDKAEALADLPVEWHHIGHLQGNKARKTLPLVRMLHGVDSAKLLLSLDGMVGVSSPQSSLDVCLQVNISAESNKHGWSPEELFADLPTIRAVKTMRIVGLMTMAAVDTEGAAARPGFARLRAIRDRLATELGRPLPVLSMGMSGDFEAGVLEGATHVRIGSALFEGAGS